jgi:hypothetical protein
MQTDEELLARTASGDDDAFAAFYRRADPLQRPGTGHPRRALQLRDQMSWLIRNATPATVTSSSITSDASTLGVVFSDMRETIHHV